MDLFLLCTVALASLLLCNVRGQDILYDKEAKGWFVLHLTPHTYVEARARCNLNGGSLAEPKNDAMGNAMKTMIARSFENTPNVFILTVIHRDMGRIYKEYYEDDDYPPQSRQDIPRAMDHTGDMWNVNSKVPYPFICFHPANETSSSTVSKTPICGTFDTEYTLDSTTDTCYKLHTKKRDWLNAFFACAVEGGQLASVNSETKLELIKVLLKDILDNESLFLGLKFNDKLKRWMNMNGQTLSEAGYEELELKLNKISPVMWSGGPCGVVNKLGDVSSERCSVKLMFICEKNAGSIPASAPAVTTSGPILD